MFIKIYRGKHSICFSFGFLLIKVFKRDLYYNWKKEVLILKKLKKDYVPKLYFYFPLIIVRQYINGIYFKDYLKKEKNKNRFIWVLKNLIKILEDLDREKIKKEELNRPTKNIIIANGFKIYLIDFERSKFKKNPRNVYEFMGFLLRYFGLLSKENINLIKNKKYEEVLRKIKNL